MASKANIIYVMIKQNKYLSLNEVHKLAHRLGLKERSAERKLNKSIAPDWIVTIYRKGCITGYAYKRAKKVIS